MSVYVEPEWREPMEDLGELTFLFEKPSGMTVPDDVEPGPVAFAHWPVGRLDVGPRGHLMLSFLHAHTAEDVVRAFPRMCEGDARVEVETMLVRHSEPLPPSVSDAQAALLDRAFGSSGFGFDALGMLRRTDRAMRGDPGPDVGAGVPRVADAPVPLPLRAGLQRMGCMTVREASYVPDADLLAMRRVGEAAVRQLREYEAACDAALEASLPAATEGARRAWDVLTGERYLPLYRVAYDASMPLAAIEEAGPGRTADVYAHAVEDLVYGMPLNFAMAQTLSAMVDEELRGFRDSAYPRVVPVPCDDGWDYVARRLSEEHPLLTYDEAAHRLEVRFPRLADWLEECDLDEPMRSIVGEALVGTISVKLCERYMLSGGKASDSVKKLLQRSPALVEDRYRHFLVTYELPGCEFSELTGEPMETLMYLWRTGAWCHDEPKPLYLAVDDPDVPEEVRERVRAWVADHYVDVGGLPTERSRDAIVYRLVAQNLGDALMPMGELRERYEQVVGEAGDPDGSLSFPSDAAFRACVSRLDGVMVLPKAAERRYGGSVRLFEPTERDLKLISVTLALYPCDGGRRSAEELFESEAIAGIMESAGVHNGYELHHVLSRHCGPIPGVRCGRSPMLEFD